MPLIGNADHKRRRTWVAWASFFGGLVIASTIASVNTFPVVTNDSLTYLGHSSAFGTYELVHVGHRQLGYPLALAVFRTIAEVLSIEPLLFAALVQTALLCLVVAGSVVVWKWGSVPLLIFALAASTVSYTNFILTEGLSLSLSIGLAVLLVTFSANVGQWQDNDRWKLWVLGLAIAVCSMALLTIRYPFAVFGLAPVGVLWASWRTSFKRPASLLLIGFLLAAGVLSIALSAENADEYGVFFPTVRGERSAFWATWSLVFTVESANPEVPELAPFYDDGDPYRFIGEVDNGGLPYPEQRELYQQAIDDLLHAAGISPGWSRVESFLWALRGGRLDDVDGIVDRVASSSRHNVDEVIHSNRYAREEGIQVFSERFNDGQTPEAVLTSEAALRAPLPDGRSSASVLLPLSILVLVIGIAHRDTRAASTVALLMVLTYAGAIGVIRADNYRFLITITAFGIAAASGIGYWLVRIRLGRLRG